MATWPELTISMLGSLQVWKPSEVATVKKNDDDDMWDLDLEDLESEDVLASYLV